jgi:hypothetical protein
MCEIIVWRITKNHLLRIGHVNVGRTGVVAAIGIRMRRPDASSRSPPAGQRHQLRRRQALEHVQLPAMLEGCLGTIPLHLPASSLRRPLAGRSHEPQLLAHPAVLKHTRFTRDVCSSSCHPSPSAIRSDTQRESHTWASSDQWVPDDSHT